MPDLSLEKKTDPVTRGSACYGDLKRRSPVMAFTVLSQTQRTLQLQSTAADATNSANRFEPFHVTAVTAFNSLSRAARCIQQSNKACELALSQVIGQRVKLPS